MGPKPAMSITLPRNFTFHYDGNDMPATPAPQSQENEMDVTQPPPPPRQTFKVRRRKAESVPRDIISDIESDALPTFEMTEAALDSSPDSMPDFAPGYLAPAASRLPLLSPPKTPVDQITAYTFDSKPTDWSAFKIDPLQRPESACSNFSDSSASSYAGSLRSFPSLGSIGLTGSCTSPESEANDPFTFNEHRLGLPVFSPDLNATSPTAKRAKTEKEAKWTPEMDEHLWSTFLSYMQNPELTPFKMLPGTAPPLGVCGRVAREARYSWKHGHGRKAGSHSQGRRKTLPNFDNAAHTTEQSLSSRTWSHWPSTESGTRKRLRKLCRRTPSLSAHYQRLVKTRSPSPFQSSSPHSRSDGQPTSTTSVRTLKPALESASNTSHVPSEPPREVSLSRPDGWYQRIGRSQAHQKSQSLHFALGSFGNPLSPAFLDASVEPATSNTGSAGSLGPSSMPKPQHEPVLKSPLELHAPVATNRSLKRRFGILDDSPANVNRLENLFSAPPVETPKPGRDRALSLGAVFHSSRSFQQQTSDEPMPDVPAIPAHLRPSPMEATRLGSPFTATPGQQRNTFPRRFTPLGSDLPAPFRPNLSLTGKFRELAAQEALRH